MTTDWPQRFLDLAYHVATWSKDPSTKVGAVIVDAQNRIVSHGYNGPPRGTGDSVVKRDIRLLRTVHAEANAILFAGRDLANCTLYVTHHPCAHCAALIIQSGITDVVHPPTDAQFSMRWFDDMQQAQIMFREAGVSRSTIQPTMEMQE